MSALPGGWADIGEGPQPIESARIPVTDRGFLLGDAVYETLRTYGGQMHAWSAHAKRLEASLGRTGIGGGRVPEGLAERCGHLVDSAYGTLRQTHPDAELIVRITMTRGDGAHGFGTLDAVSPRLVLLARPFMPPDDEFYLTGVTACTAMTTRIPVRAQDPSVKATSALNLIQAKREAEAKGADEALMCDETGAYLEATGANLFVWDGEAWWTPAPEQGVLGGVTAGAVLGIIEARGEPVRRSPIPGEVMRRAVEVFLTQTSREVIPVTALDGAPVDNGRPGPRTRAIHAAFRGLTPRGPNTAPTS